MSKKEMERKTFDAVITDVDADRGVVKAVFSVFGSVDLGLDRIHSGAFSKTFAERGLKVLVLDNHNTHSTGDVIAKTINLRELRKDELPPQVLTQYPDATGGAEITAQFEPDPEKDKASAGAFYRLKNNWISQWSFGYDALDYDYTTETVDGKEVAVRNLRTLRLYEVSPVLYPMQPATTTTLAKASDKEEAMEKEKSPSESKPWNVFHEGDQYCVYKLDEDGNRTGESLGCHDSEEEARQQVEALYANEEASGDTASEEKAITSEDKRVLTSELRGLSMTDLVATHRRLHQQAAAGNTLTGFSRSDMNWFHAATEKELRRRAENDDREPPEATPLEWGSGKADEEMEEGDEEKHFPSRIAIIRRREEAYNKSKDAAPPGEGKAENLSEQVEDVRNAFSAQYNPPTGPWHYWVSTVYDEYVIISYEGDQGTQWFQVPYTREEDRITFAPRADWVEGNYEFTPGQKAEEKAGRVLAARNAQRIRDAVSLLTEALKDAGLIEEEEQEKANDAPDNDRAADNKEQDGPPSPTSDEAGPQAESPAPEGSDDIEDQVLDAELESLELELRLMEV